MDFERCVNQPDIVARLAWRGTSNVERIGDGELSTLLVVTGYSAGVMRVDGRLQLIALAAERDLD